MLWDLWRKMFWLSKFDFCRLFHTERSWQAYWFSAVIVSSQHDLPSDARAFSLTSFEMLSSSLQLFIAAKIMVLSCLISPKSLHDLNYYYLSTRLTEHKRVMRNGDVNNHTAEDHLKMKHQINWDSATCITYSTDYYQRLTLKIKLVY